MRQMIQNFDIATPPADPMPSGTTGLLQEVMAMDVSSGTEGLTQGIPTQTLPDNLLCEWLKDRNLKDFHICQAAMCGRQDEMMTFKGTLNDWGDMEAVM